MFWIKIYTGLDYGKLWLQNESLLFQLPLTPVQNENLCIY